MKSSSVTEDEIRRPRGVQCEDVWAAADAVLLAGEKPTIERVRQHLGSGSPNTVGPLLEQWFKHLGRRIQDPGAFAAPAGVPDPVLQAARHFWETALAQTRGDFDERLRQGLADAIANVEAEKERAEIAGAAAFEASAKANRLQGELAEQAQLLRRAQEALAAESARLQEVRAALAAEKERLLEERLQASDVLVELKRQVAAAVERADAADRRVAMELDRERTSRLNAERHAQSLQKSLDAAHTTNSAASKQAQQEQLRTHAREQALNRRLAALTDELSIEREHQVQVRADLAAKAAEAKSMASQVSSLQALLDRLAKQTTSTPASSAKLAKRTRARPDEP